MLATDGRPALNAPRWFLLSLLAVPLCACPAEPVGAADAASADEGGDATSAQADAAPAADDGGAGATDAGLLESPDAELAGLDGGSTAADAGPVTADASPPAADAGPAARPDAWTPFAGSCDPAFPGAPTGSWRHPVKSPAIAAEGSPNHRVRDQVVSPGEATSLRAHFTYGVFDADLPDEDAEVWLRRCPGWEMLGTVTLDGDGVGWAAMPTDLPKGEYAVRVMLLGDGTTADGVLAVWPQGTQALVTDLDGTMTTDDWQAYQDVIGLGSADLYPDANTAMNLWAAKGYRLLYLTARPQLISRYSREWLVSQAFPAGPLMLFEDGTAWVSTDAEKVAFKGGRIQEIAAKGVAWRAAYGNATTDIDAYANASIPKADTYIIGANAGASGTQAVTSYTDHLPVVAGYPDAVQP